ncbi:nitrite/sulfite reductase [Devosia sp. J2-20]|jgi:sulfite reductase (NADPH) hemoprotein beta-component|uniref:nitrite/sulfite reductase n=1 Tax=Devosia TaxID=46913 RepID=UPI0022AF2678|nr:MULTISPECIES: nitrite/sulfite reductase [Devosia]MCZ4345853.1 nitrite/sulfite reductase [Devosia neptuniae]WDQ99015.1 nitrite/sulfite reductase [Devosia sp. J2-20]|tara:strand:- start:10498 stop:12156 length:1659 start_codon:yes stop_codon:yes gene_type:complete
MYRYDEFDAAFVAGRTAQFSDQVHRRLSGELSEDQFRPLRLMNGLYLQLHAYMLRVAVPYGTLSSKQMRKLAHIARTYDRGYGHFTTRQNIQYNWPKLKDVPVILEELASVEMHAIQTSGNCIRNVTTDQFAGAAADEIIDPRPVAEIIRQWSSLHPEFSYLPRKFKIAMTGSPNDRAAIRFHDIGLQAAVNAAGDIGWEVWVGGGLGRTPMIGKLLNSFVPNEHLLAYLESIMRVYNRYGRRDNKYKARIKILVHEEGLETIKGQVETEFAEVRGGVLTLPQAELDRITTYFAPPAFSDQSGNTVDVAYQSIIDPAYGRWLDNNLNAHSQPGYASVTISLKPVGGAPGDATDAQMDVVADLAERYSFDELRVTHEQNLVLPHVAVADLRAVYDALVQAKLADGNTGLITDMICCPGLDFCALANARSIPIAQEISHKFAAPERQAEIGDLKIKISGCINACGHHHVGHIGILGVEKKGGELYQITLGGDATEQASVGKIIGPGFEADAVPGAIEKLVDTYIAQRQSTEESFIEAYRRLGEAPFKEALYGAA